MILKSDHLLYIQFQWAVNYTWRWRLDLNERSFNVKVIQICLTKLCREFRCSTRNVNKDKNTEMMRTIANKMVQYVDKIFIFSRKFLSSHTHTHTQSYFFGQCGIKLSIFSSNCTQWCTCWYSSACISVYLRRSRTLHREKYIHPCNKFVSDWKLFSAHGGRWFQFRNQIRRRRWYRHVKNNHRLISRGRYWPRPAVTVRILLMAMNWRGWFIAGELKLAGAWRTCVLFRGPRSFSRVFRPTWMASAIRCTSTAIVGHG